jgi:hypothetical protein
MNRSFLRTAALLGLLALGSGLYTFDTSFAPRPDGKRLRLRLRQDQPSLLGLRVSNGCIRVSNAAIQSIWRLAPTGRPVLIQA